MVQKASNPKADILVVDDMPDNIRLLSNILIEQGYKVRKAINGQIALTAAQSLPPDLILLDINMPRMNGYEVCKKLKENAQTLSIPVIFLSALDEVLDKIQAFQVGAVDYITKPFQFEEVLVRIKTQLTIRDLQAQLQAQNFQLQQALNALTTAQFQSVQKEKLVDTKQLAAGVSWDDPNSAYKYVQDLLRLIDLYQQEYPNPTPPIQEAINGMNLSLLTPQALFRQQSSSD